MVAILELLHQKGGKNRTEFLEDYKIVVLNLNVSSSVSRISSLAQTQPKPHSSVPTSSRFTSYCLICGISYYFLFLFLEMLLISVRTCHEKS